LTFIYPDVLSHLTLSLSCEERELFMMLFLFAEQKHPLLSGEDYRRGYKSGTYYPVRFSVQIDEGKVAVTHHILFPKCSDI